MDQCRYCGTVDDSVVDAMCGDCFANIVPGITSQEVSRSNDLMETLVPHCTGQT